MICQVMKHCSLLLLIQFIPCIIIAHVSCFLVKFNGFLFVLWHTISILITECKIDHCFGVAHVRCSLK